MTEWIALAIAAVASAAVTRLVIRHALSHGVMDVPNARSSHSTPTPRGGGVAIVIVTLAGTALLGALQLLSMRITFALLAAGAMVAVVGYIDDRVGLPAARRFGVHLAASLLVVICLFGIGAGQGGILAWVAIGLMVIGSAWSINLFNFMDGIDGIAASQAVFVMGASAALVYFSSDSALLVLPLVTAGACLGFLFWNRPPARIFMGDAGSGFLGLWLAAVALLLYRDDLVGVWVSVTLNSLFIADATVTLLRRMLTGAKWYEAHRSHAYQRLSRRLSSHGKVTLLLWVLNLLVVLPLAWCALCAPQYALPIAVGSIAFFGALAMVAGAGKPDGA